MELVPEPTHSPVPCGIMDRLLSGHCGFPWHVHILHYLQKMWIHNQHVKCHIMQAFLGCNLASTDQLMSILQLRCHFLSYHLPICSWHQFSSICHHLGFIEEERKSMHLLPFINLLNFYYLPFPYSFSQYLPVNYSSEPCFGDQSEQFLKYKKHR